MKLNFLNRLFTKIPILETDRLLLREVKKSDVKDIYEYSANPKTSEFLLWDVHKSQEYTKEFIEYVIGKYKSGEYNDWALVYKFNNKMIDSIEFIIT
jgi:ribosomal-protein-alanine N-acetyltransferase